jgi:ABC-2 type transport system ATP-binding protein
MPAAAIHCEALTKRYGRTLAVDGVELRVEPGEAFGFVGPNGAGKTTTIRLLMGFLRPTSGTARIFGQDAWRAAVEVHRQVGNLPGDFDFDRRRTGREILRHVARLRGASADALAYADELADRLHADLDRPLGALSRGNHQKIGLIQAMFDRPRLLLLDEPTSGLDPLMQETFITLIGEARAAGATVFLSSHNLVEVERTCERVGIIRAAKLVATESVDTLAARALRHVEVSFEGMAPTAEAIGAIPGARDVTIDGNRATLRMAGNLDDLVRFLGGYRVADLTVQRASLEELFLSFYAEGATTDA